MAPRPHDGVQQHYAQLAADYGRKANQACERAYAALAGRCLGNCEAVLEIGAGCSSLLETLGASLRVACDFSEPMLRARAAVPGVTRVAGDAERLPFGSGRFDGLFSINVVEHVRDPERVFAEAARVLAPGGQCLMVTPNGDVEFLLDLLEKLHLKLPEGPHRFLTTKELAEIGRAAGLKEVEHSRFLAFPAGPPGFVKLVDRAAMGWGLFQYILLRKP